MAKKQPPKSNVLPFRGCRPQPPTAGSEVVADAPKRALPLAERDKLSALFVDPLEVDALFMGELDDLRHRLMFIAQQSFDYRASSLATAWSDAVGLFADRALRACNRTIIAADSPEDLETFDRTGRLPAPRKPETGAPQ